MPYDDTALLARAHRLLHGIDAPPFMRVAIDHGYTPSVHATGWSLYRNAGGDAPPPRTLATPPSSEPSLAREARELHAFAELWFLRTKAILRRVVPLRRRDAFEAEFFEGLSLDGDIDVLICSLRTFFQRFERLPTHPTPGTRTLAVMLRARGLTDPHIAAIRARLDVLDAARTIPAAPLPPPPTAMDERHAARSALRAWYRTWSDVLKGCFPPRQCARLGLTS
jgi:hypothetical protein